MRMDDVDEDGVHQSGSTKSQLSWNVPINRTQDAQDSRLPHGIRRMWLALGDVSGCDLCSYCLLRYEFVPRYVEG